MFLIKLLRLIFIVLFLPIYILLYLQIISFVSVINRIRGVFSSYIISRKDRLFSGVFLILLSFYLFIFLGYSDYLMPYILTGKIAVIYNRFLFFFFSNKNICIYLFYSSIIFSIFDIVIFKKILDSYRKPGAFSRFIHRKFAARRGAVFAGTTKDKKSKPLYVTDDMRSLHVHCVGTTGTGKSESFIFPWAWQDMLRGHGVIIIDAKGDRSFFEKIYSYHHTYNTNNNQSVKYVDLSRPTFSNTYNPIFRGNALELKDRIMGAFDWSEQYYKTKSESSLISILNACKAVNKNITFKDLYLLYREKRAVEYLYSLVEHKNQDVARSLYNDVILNFDSLQKECAGLISNLQIMSSGGIDEIINSYNPDIDLLKVYESSDIVYFSLPTGLIGETARAFGKMLLMDLRATAGYIEQGQVSKKFFPVFIDEFAEFATGEFVSWLNKARSSGFSLHIAHQSIGDIESVDEAFVKQIIDNTNIKVLFRVNDSETAENFSKQLGTFTTIKETERVEKTLITQTEGAMGSLREVEEFIVSPNVIKRGLERGQSVIFGKHPKFFSGIYVTDYVDDLPVDKKISVVLDKNEPIAENALNMMQILDSITDAPHVQSPVNKPEENHEIITDNGVIHAEEKVAVFDSIIFPDLDGSPKQIQWAERVRKNFFNDVEHLAGGEYSDKSGELFAALKGVIENTIGAGHWIDNRKKDIWWWLGLDSER